MTSMAHQSSDVIGGVDTHGHTHHAALVDPIGRHLADKEFPATRPGYEALLAWMSERGRLVAAGVEGTGAYGAGLARHLATAGVKVIEVDRPDRRTRRSKGKSDPIDAYAAAQAVVSGRASGMPKTRSGTVEAIRSLRVARRGAVKARTQAMNQLRQLLITGEADLRARLRDLSAAALIAACARLRPGSDLSAPAQALKFALRRLARRHQYLGEEIADLDAELKALTARAAPALLELKGVGSDVAGQLLATVGDNPDRLRSQAAFAHLCGVAPIPASSGRRDRHRLNRGGDRAANHALHTVVLCRMRHEERTRAYVERRTADGLAKKDIMRCLKRYVAREVYQVLTSKNTPTSLRRDDFTEAA